MFSAYCRSGRAFGQNAGMSLEYQAAIIGGGPAGLQAALTLGRMHVETVLFDDVRYRNASSPKMGNVLGWDGAEPAALRTAARAELAECAASLTRLEAERAEEDRAGREAEAAERSHAEEAATASAELISPCGSS